MEKLLRLARELNVSLDSLMAGGAAPERADGPAAVTGSITISSPHEHVAVTCSKVMASPRFKGGKNAPKYALFAAGNDSASFWGPQNTFLGWYADAGQLEKEIAAVTDAISRGMPAYELQYSVKAETKLFGVKISDAQ